MKLVIMISLLLFVTAHFPFSVSIPPLLPSPSRLHFPHLLTCLFLLFLSPSLLLLLLLLFSMTPPSSLISHLSQVASCLVTFSSSTWLCRQENQTLSESPQGKPNADRAWTLALLFVVEGWAFREIKRSQSSELCWNASPPCWDILLVINALWKYGKYQGAYETVSTIFKILARILKRLN